MCGTTSRTPTVDSGDLIAIIHPTPSPTQSRLTPHAFLGGRLRLSNRTAGATISEMVCRSAGSSGCWSSSGGSSEDSENSETTSNELLNVRIHKYGQPLTSSPQAPKNPILHSFFITPSESSTAGIRFNLGVGGDGVVGRTVSVLDSRRRVLGEGVIGWG